MNHTTATLNNLVNWVHDTRQSAPLVEHEAHRLLQKLAALKSHHTQLDAQGPQPLSIGLYGHSVEGKHHLLTTLLADNHGRIEIALGEKVLDYLTHINPGHAPSIGVRLTHRPQPTAEHYPLLLTLHTACSLAQRMIRDYHASPAPRMATPDVISARLKAFQARRQAQPGAGLTADCLADIAQTWQLAVRRPHHLAAHLWQQMADLLPWLSCADQASLLAPLWGDQNSLTSQWQRLAETLQHVGHSRQVLAPSSLLVDTFLLPVEGFLIPATPDEPEINADVMVCPLLNHQTGTPVSIAHSYLQQLSAEITLTLNHAPKLAGIEVVDIPQGQLDDYAQRLQPDKLVVCNATASRQDVSNAGKTLARWVDNTQTNHATSPGLIWAITPSDARFSGANFDEGVQRMIGLPGKRWGTLQALDSRNMHRLLEWFAEALTPAQRTQRISQLQSTLKGEINTLFSHFRDDSTPSQEQVREQAQALVRALQAWACQHGELLASLLPGRHALEQCWLRHQHHNRQQSAALSLDIDLFAEEDSHDIQRFSPESFATQVHVLWVNHLRESATREEIAQISGLDKPQLQALCQLLIVTSYRLELSAQLESALRHGNRSMAQEISCVSAVLGDFLSWLGYAHIEPTHRPASRVNKGSPVFAPAVQATAATRLVRLGEQPARGNTHYVYDWLVALYTRAIENRGYRHPWDLSDVQRETLKEILAPENVLVPA